MSKFARSSFAGPVGTPLPASSPERGGPFAANGTFSAPVLLDGSGGCYSAAGLGAFARFTAPLALQSDAHARFTLRALSAGSGRAGVTFRDSASSALYWLYHNQAAHTYNIALGTTVLATSAPMPIPLGADGQVVCQASALGGTLMLAVDGETVLTASDSSVTGGSAGVGFIAGDAVNSGLHLRDLHAWDASPAPTQLDEVLRAFRDRLIAAGLARSPEAVEISLEEEPIPTLSGTRFVVAPLDGTVDESSVLQGGRDATRIDGGVTVHVIHRKLSDKAGADRVRLTEFGKGLLHRAHQAIDALHVKYLLGPVGVPVTIEPIRLTFDARPMRTVDGAGYARVELDFTVAYQLNLSTDDGGDPYALFSL